ncbi:SidA/IucD/PvdA family monooxygenase, partial [Bacillus pumilus]|uniref:SidA/IucD/PvdA family monooxygenase n=1 Tax=Bacillus pumilus TaxID=1408 RepID=UPI0016424C94
VEVFESKDVVLGIGREGGIGGCVEGGLGEKVFDCGEYLKGKKEGCLKGKCVRVMGCGESGGEVLYDILGDDEGKEYVEEMGEFGCGENGEVIVVCGKMESEIA